MDLVTCEKKSAHFGVFPFESVNESSEKTLQLLVFVIQGKHFAIDLTETRDVVREAYLRHQDNTKPSIVKGIIRRNRRNVIVVNLNRCLRLQWGFDIDEKYTGILMLDEKVGDSNLGILVNGISSIVTVKCSQFNSDPARSGGNTVPIHGFIRKAGSGIASGKPIIWINIRNLVNNCSPDNLFADAEPEAGRTAEL